MQAAEPKILIKLKKGHYGCLGQTSWKKRAWWLEDRILEEVTLEVEQFGIVTTSSRGKCVKEFTI
jgi:hypothetical protein